MEHKTRSKKEKKFSGGKHRQAKGRKRAGISKRGTCFQTAGPGSGEISTGGTSRNHLKKARNSEIRKTKAEKEEAKLKD